MARKILGSPDIELWHAGAYGNVSMKEIALTGVVAAIDDTIRLGRIPRNWRIFRIDLVTETLSAALDLSLGTQGGDGDDEDDDDRFFASTDAHAKGTVLTSLVPYQHDSTAAVYLEAKTTGGVLASAFAARLYVLAVNIGSA